MIPFSNSSWICTSTSSRKCTGIRRDGIRTGVPAVGMPVTNKSLNLSTTVSKHVLIISGNSTLGGDPNFGISHSSVYVFHCFPYTCNWTFLCLEKTLSVHIGFIGGADSWFALSFEGAAVTGVVVKSNTSPCNCRKSVPNITAVIKSFTTTKSWSFSSVPSRTVAFTYPKMGRLSPTAITSRISCLGCVRTTPVAF